MSTRRGSTIPPAGRSIVFPLAVETPLRIPRLAAHFAQNQSEIEGSVRVSDRPNSQRSMQPPAVGKSRKSQRSRSPNALSEIEVYHFDDAPKATSEDLANHIDDTPRQTLFAAAAKYRLRGECTHGGRDRHGRLFTRAPSRFRRKDGRPPIDWMAAAPPHDGTPAYPAEDPLCLALDDPPGVSGFGVITRFSTI